MSTGDRSVGRREKGNIIHHVLDRHLQHISRERYRPEYLSPFHEKVEGLFNAMGDIVLAGFGFTCPLLREGFSPEGNGSLPKG